MLLPLFVMWGIGLIVVIFERDLGSALLFFVFFVIPPQVQVEISTRKKIITDEHSGRILIDPDLAREEKEKMEEFFQAM